MISCGRTVACIDIADGEDALRIFTFSGSMLRVVFAASHLHWQSFATTLHIS